MGYSYTRRIQDQERKLAAIPAAIAELKQEIAAARNNPDYTDKGRKQRITLLENRIRQQQIQQKQDQDLIARFHKLAEDEQRKKQEAQTKKKRK